jgi:hypothetical protein
VALEFDDTDLVGLPGRLTENQSVVAQKAIEW